MKDRPCLAITLVNPREPKLASSYLWCTLGEHESGMHVSYCGMWWMTGDIVEPTDAMVIWRTGTAEQVREISGRMV